MFKKISEQPQIIQFLIYAIVTLFLGWCVLMVTSTILDSLCDIVRTIDVNNERQHQIERLIDK